MDHNQIFVGGFLKEKYSQASGVVQSVVLARLYALLDGLLWKWHPCSAESES